ncbi:MAG: sugar phosphate isomerase/epimerase [Oscillospiraceae bacterium]|jgi:sugar phosphate isomerase/epimerase|nr:sugar phosphate isomerase/epimerase [Oscillospiraceae bacterium]
MELGLIIDANSKADFERLASFGIKYAELCINVGTDAKKYLDRAEEIAAWTEETGTAVASIGRWGTNRLNPDGSFNEPEYQNDLALIALCGKLGCTSFVCGCNEPREVKSFDDRIACAVKYFAALIEAGKPSGVHINVYNCDWNNFVWGYKTWDKIFPLLPELGLKYDISHCLNRGGDYMQELMQYGVRIGHFHVKGTVRVHGRNVQDPPAGLDDIPWGAVFAILYHHKYNGVCSIEPHSGIWNTGEQGDWGIRFARDFIGKYLFHAG